MIVFIQIQSKQTNKREWRMVDKFLNTTIIRCRSYPLVRNKKKIINFEQIKTQWSHDRHLLIEIRVNLVFFFLPRPNDNVTFIMMTNNCTAIAWNKLNVVGLYHNSHCMHARYWIECQSFRFSVVNVLEIFFFNFKSKLINQSTNQFKSIPFLIKKQICVNGPEQFWPPSSLSIFHIHPPHTHAFLEDDNVGHKKKWSIIIINHHIVTHIYRDREKRMWPKDGHHHHDDNHHLDGSHTHTHTYIGL